MHKSVLAFGLLASSLVILAAMLLFNNNNIAMAQEGSVFIAPGAADPNNDQSFNPPQTSVSSGSTVFWTNEDSTEHTVTSDEGSFNSGPISSGDTFDNIFDTSGEFGYHSQFIHS